MPIDPSIILGVKPPQYQAPDPLDTYSKGMTLKALMGQDQLQQIQTQTALQGLQDDQDVRGAYKSAGSDSAALRALLQGKGQYKALQALDKFELEKRKDTATLKHTEAQTADMEAGRIAAGLAALSRGGGSDDSVRQLVELQAPHVGQEAATAMGASLMAMPQDQRVRYMIDHAVQHPHGQAALKLLFPEAHLSDTGGAITPVTTATLPGGPAAGSIVPGSVVTPKTLTPGEVQTGAHQKVEERQGAERLGIERERAGRERTQVVTNTDGTVTVVDKDKRTSAPVMDAEGKPLQSKNNLTESQGKATGMALRAREAEGILERLEKEGVLNRSIIKQGVETIPVVGGGLAMGANYVASSKQQQVEQARRNFVNAVLRVESGASINEGEFRNAERQYFPMPGDDKATIAQKRDNRKTAIQALEMQSGPGRPAAAAPAKPAASTQGIRFLGYEG